MFRIQFLGGVRNKTTTKLSYAPRVLQLDKADYEAGSPVGIYRLHEIDHDVKVAVYKFTTTEDV